MGLFHINAGSRLVYTFSILHSRYLFSCESKTIRQVVYLLVGCCRSVRLVSSWRAVYSNDRKPFDQRRNGEIALMKIPH